MNKQVVIAGLLSAIAAEAEDPTPCEDFVTKAAAEELAAAEVTLAAWEGKIAGLAGAVETSETSRDTARDAYKAVTAAILPFYQAEQEAYTAYTTALNARTAANNLLTDITNASGTEPAANTQSTISISGENMLLRLSDTTVGLRNDDIVSAQSAYNTKSAEINDATFEHDTDGTVAGYRARLTAEYKVEETMLDAQDLADDAEALAISNLTAQEAVMNGLKLIEGCTTVVAADVSANLNQEVTDGTKTQSEVELETFQLCCTTRMATYLATLPTASGSTNPTDYPADCSTNAGWGMKKQQDTYNTEQTSTETAYTTHCTSDTSTPSCNTESDYTTYKGNYVAAMKNRRMLEFVDTACKGTGQATDCSNGNLTNSSGGNDSKGADYGYAKWAVTDTSEAGFFMLHPANGASASATNPGLTNIYRDSIVAASLDSTYDATAWTTKYQDLAKKLKDWTVAEARYYAYTASWSVHEALIQTAQTTETALEVTKEQKIDLSAAADQQVLAAADRVQMAKDDLADEITALAALQDAVTAAEEAHAVQVWLAAQAQLAADTQSAIVADWSEVCGVASDVPSSGNNNVSGASCSDALADLLALHTSAQENLADVQTALNCTTFVLGDLVTAAAGQTPAVYDSSCSGFYRDRLDEAELALGVDQALLSDAEDKVRVFADTVSATAQQQIDALTDAQRAGNIQLKVNMLKVALVDAIADCKGLGYDKAQLAKKALMDLEAANETAAAEVAIDYADKSAFADTGETNTLCAYPAKGADGSQEARPECSDGYCCGAAQKFLKDGTKLAIETCQKAEGVHTYDYYPPLPEGSPVEPTPETWRFQCISGAQKLAATAAAALAASYMMA